MAINKDFLPSPVRYLDEHGLLQSKGRGWVMIKCPAHKNGQEKTPSMSINLDIGCFRCFSCGVSGRDIIAFHQIRTGLDFVSAVEDLGGKFHV